MPREGIDYPGWFNRAACSIRCELSKLWSAVGTKVAKLNTVEPNGDGKVNVVSDTAALIVTDDQGNNAVRLSLDPAVVTPPVQSVNGATGTVVLDGSDVYGTASVYNGTSLVSTTSSINYLLYANANGSKTADDALRTRMTAAESAITTETNTRIAEDALLQSALNGKADVGDSYTKQESDARYADVATPHTWAEEQTFDDGIDVNGDADVSGDLNVGGDLDVTGATTLRGSLTANGSITRNQPSYTKQTVVCPYDVTVVNDSAWMIYEKWVDMNNVKLAEIIRSGGSLSLHCSDDTGTRVSNITLNNKGTVTTITPGASAGSTEIATVGYVSNTGGSLNNLLHNSGNESFSGIKTGNVTNYGTAFRTRIPAIDVTNPPSSETLGFLSFCDTNNIALVTIRAGYSSTGRVVIGVSLRNNDGTTKYITLGTADN